MFFNSISGRELSERILQRNQIKMCSSFLNKDRVKYHFICKQWRNLKCQTLTENSTRVAVLAIYFAYIYVVSLHLTVHKFNVFMQYLTRR